jgi:hypothetical protein
MQELEAPVQEELTKMQGVRPLHAYVAWQRSTGGSHRRGIHPGGQVETGTTVPETYQSWPDPQPSAAPVMLIRSAFSRNFTSHSRREACSRL